MNYIPFIFIFIVAIYIKYPNTIILSQNVKIWHSKGKIYNANHMQIFYIDDFNDAIIENHTILCLHGFPTSSFDWMKIWTNLTSHYQRVITLDFLGYGFSDKPDSYEEYSIMKQTDLLEQLIAHLNVTNFHILAHDVGDTIAQELLSRKVEREKKLLDQKYSIHSVCLLNGGIFVQTNFPRISQKLMRTPYIGRIFGYLINYYLFSHGFSEIFGPNTQPSDEDLRDFWSLIRNKDGHIVLPLLLQYIGERQRNDVRWTQALQTTDIKIHVIFGNKDPVNPILFVDELRNRVPNATIDILDEIGHYPQWEAPYFTFNSFIKFVDKL